MSVMICFTCTSVLLFADQTTNPFTVKPSYTFWAPWIGRLSRRGNMVINTEHRKCNRIPTGTQAEKEIGDGDTIVENNLSEEELIEMMHFAQVSDKSK